MKRIRCPKCEESIVFDENLYEQGRVLVFECQYCHKQFKIRIPNVDSGVSDKDHEEEQNVLGWIIVIENVFHLKQYIPLKLGVNKIGRWVKGTKANAAIRTVDPSVDTTHCIINVRIQNNQPHFVLYDGPSGTGSFFNNDLLGVNEKVVLSDGDIITIGASTLIFSTSEPDN